MSESFRAEIERNLRVRGHRGAFGNGRENLLGAFMLNHNGLLEPFLEPVNGSFLLRKTTK